MEVAWNKIFLLFAVLIVSPTLKPPSHRENHFLRLETNYQISVKMTDVFPSILGKQYIVFFSLDWQSILSRTYRESRLEFSRSEQTLSFR